MYKLITVYSREKCSQLKVVHKPKLFTTQSCSQLKVVHNSKFFTTQSCSQLKVLHNSKFFTTQNSSQLKVLHKILIPYSPSYGRGKASDTCPPVNSEGARYDCCVNEIDRPEVFVVYKPNHLIPRFYIEFGPQDNEL